MDEVLTGFDFPTQEAPIIKVIGVGGGGGNAVNHMFKEGIQDVTFIVCNTDYQALKACEVPIRLQLGKTITEGLGAGNNPLIAKDAAEESLPDLQRLLSDGTKMAFITAGMGGGTGTGAAPIVAQIAKEMGILTVGIVTIPFQFEGKDKIIQALRGVVEIRKNVDALLVINNEKLVEIYGNMDLPEGLKKADDTLSTAAKSIAEIITRPGYINLDFADVNATLKNGGVAIMSSGVGEGEDRVAAAFDSALHSPLLNNNDVFNARKILFNVYFSQSKPLKMNELNEINEFMIKFKVKEIKVIWGAAIDDALEEKIKVTVLATGFDIANLPLMKEMEEEDNKLDEEEKRRQEEEQIRIQMEKEKVSIYEERMITEYYGEEISRNLIKRPMPKPFIFSSIDQMDDNETIDALINHPTYNRNSKIMLDIIRKAESRRAVENSPVAVF
ncbi:MAG: cell division protein FtsZ [Candidatus Azobacteroides sp.]|nr:cell division protein FtsZ [Candidatus Azobacteroides sp.]